MAVSTMASIPALKTVHQQLKTRMEKAVNDFRRTWRPRARGARISRCWIMCAFRITARRCR